jgi:hypothetical protein
MSMLRVLPLLLVAGVAHAAGTGPIYTCVDANGKKLTSDRPIAECVAREQRVLNRDGSLRRVLPPNLTADERAVIEARERDEAAERMAQQEATRRDRELLRRYPNEATHRRARETALEPVRRSLHSSQARLEDLAKERKPLMDETEFYVGKRLPGKLKQAIDANDAAAEATRALIADRQAELVRLDDFYDDELRRLKALWGGAAPGSQGPTPTPPMRAAVASQPR